MFGLFVKEGKRMKKVTVCIGSSCHVKGSCRVIERLQYLISQNELGDEVELAGKFCMGKCAEGVCVDVDGNHYSVSPDTVDEFFSAAILG